MATQKATADAARARAEARFHLSEQRKSEAEQVMRNIHEAQLAERAKTERLRALRLARDAAEREAQAGDDGKAKRTKAVRRRLAS